MANLSYTDAVRIYSIYFTERVTDLSSINTKTFSNGFLRNNNNNNNNQKAYEIIQSKIGSSLELDLKNFLIFSYSMLNDYSNDKDNFDNLHVSKENNSIFKFIKSIIDFKGMIKDCDTLDSTQINQLKIIHYTLLDKFSSNDNLVQATTINSVNDLLSQSQINLNANTNANANTSGDRIDRVINNNKKDFKLIKKYINKLLRYESHLKINKIHTDAKTTPKSLFYERFPSPFFQEDPEFIDSYNIIIEKAQNEIMNLIKETLESRISKTKSKIQEYKDDSLNLTKYSEFDPQDIINSIYKTEERSLLDTFIKNKSKAERCIAKPFEPKTDLNNSARSSNASIRSNYSSKSNNSSVNWANKNSYRQYRSPTQINNNNNNNNH